MREPKTLVEKVWERHLVHRAEGERAAHLRRACGGDTRRGCVRHVERSEKFAWCRLGYCQRFCHKSFGLWPQDSS
jgi:hypothetical protein